MTGALTPFTTGATFDPVTGLPLTTTDVNGQVTTIEYNDPLLRPTKVIAPHGQQTITEYGAGTSAATRYVKARTQIDETNWKEGYAWYDGLGRTYKTQSIDSNGDVFTETEFDDQGRPKRATNPYRSGETKVWTTTNYDTAGRPFEVVTADGAKVTTAYGVATSGANLGTVVTVTDQALKQRRSITNALGQLTRVDEPDETGNLGEIASPNQATFYSYDTLNNLITVNQGGQVRSFAYDSLSRLKQATNPESGLINYAYDNNGNLTTKTDARSITTSYGYDNLNRVTTRNYTGESGYQTPAVSYFYDSLPNAKGKLTKIVTAATATNQIAETRYTSFDILGRVLSSSQVTDGQTYNSGYVYNLSGALMEQTYPSGRVVKNTLDADGNLAQVQSAKANGTFQNYANTFTYTAAGAVSSMRLGNGRWENTSFNARLQPVQIGLGTSATNQNLLKLNYDYGTTDNNGNVKSQQINFQGLAQPFIQTYTYDSLNRLKSAVENQNGAQNWKQTFTFDRFGNRRFDTNSGNTTTLASGCATAICNPEINAQNNRLIGTTFDNAGNTTVDASGQTFIYDAENKQIQVSNSSGIVGQYFYDGDGKRVKKIVPASGETTIFVYDAGGKMVAEYSTVTANTPQVSYLTNDTLGSPRITTDANGAVISRRDFMPFGEEISRAGYGTDAVRQKFTAYERDNETDLDFAQARMFGSGVGRFTSADPTLLSLRRDNPQTLNRYAYVLNNPLNLVDPFGLWELKSQNIYKTKKDDNGNEVIDVDKHGNKIVARVEIVAFKTKADDDGASLAKQLGLNGDEGKAFANEIGSVDGIQLSGSTNKTVSSVFGNAEKGLADEAESQRKDGKSPDGPNCAGVSCSVGGLGGNRKQYLDPESFGSDLDSKVKKGKAESVSADSLRVGDIARYATSDNKAKHFANFIFRDDAGVPIVFSKSGASGPYHITTAKSLEGTHGKDVVYGNINGYFRAVKKP